MRRLIETVVIGARQAGLAISYYLSRAGLAHVVLERSPAVANAWRNQRRDSFTRVTPNFQVRMSGAEYQGPIRTDSCRGPRSSRISLVHEALSATRQAELEGVGPGERWFGRQGDTQEGSQ